MLGIFNLSELQESESSLPLTIFWISTMLECHSLSWLKVMSKLELVPFARLSFVILILLTCMTPILVGIWWSIKECLWFWIMICFLIMCLGKTFLFPIYSFVEPRLLPLLLPNSYMQQYKCGLYKQSYIYFNKTYTCNIMYTAMHFSVACIDFNSLLRCILIGI